MKKVNPKIGKGIYNKRIKNGLLKHLIRGFLPRLLPILGGLGALGGGTAGIAKVKKQLKEQWIHDLIMNQISAGPVFASLQENKRIVSGSI